MYPEMALVSRSICAFALNSALFQQLFPSVQKRNALTFASGLGHDAVVRLLFEHGAKVRLRHPRAHHNGVMLDVPL